MRAFFHDVFYRENHPHGMVGGGFHEGTKNKKPAAYVVLMENSMPGGDNENFILENGRCALKRAQPSITPGASPMLLN